VERRRGAEGRRRRRAPAWVEAPRRGCVLCRRGGSPGEDGVRRRVVQPCSGMDLVQRRGGKAST
jgi:hypothetical protein